MKWILNFVRRRRVDSELAQEVESHLEEKVADLMEGGMPEREAREKANREFGNVTLYREISREVWGWTWLETLLQDLHYSARMLRTNPGFTFVATATLALGIAVNSTIFSVVSGWLLKPPAVADPERVVTVVSTNAKRHLEREEVSAVDFLAWRTANHMFENLAAADVDHGFNLTGAGEPERVVAMRVSAAYFRVLCVKAMLGRAFLPEEDRPGRDRVVVLSYGLWQRRFASDPHIIGKTVALDGDKYLVIGVMPGSFRLMGFLAQVWTPLVFRPEELTPKARDTHSFLLFARLKPGIPLEQARAEMAALARRSELNYPSSEKGWSANVMTLQEYSIQNANFRPALVMLMTAVGFVLVIACANIANLLLGRSAKRQQEIAIRTALGAGRMRLIRQLLVESLLIALIGGGAGLVGAYWGIDALRGTANFNEYVIAIAGDIALDQRVLAFTFLVSVAAALVFGLAPAIRVSATDPQSTLRHGGRAGDLRRSWGRNVLVGAEIALAMVLVSGAGLMIKATAEDVGGDFGFDPARVLTAGISLTNARYHDSVRQTAFFQSVIERLRGLPGVEAATVSDALPFNAGKLTFSLQGQPVLPAGERPKARYFAVGPDYFRVLNIPLIQGRVFRESDNTRALAVALINRVFANRFFAGQNPVGRRISIDTGEPGNPAWREIIGITGDIKASYGSSKEEDAQMYVPYLQAPEEKMQIAVRAAGDTNLLASALRRAVWSVDPDQPVGRVLTLSRMIDEGEGGDWVLNTLFGIFAFMALVLSAVGIYGVVAYAVAQRTHEIGIRMALGAHRGDVLRSVVGKGMLLATASAAAGLAAAAPLPKLFSAVFYSWRVHPSAIFMCVPLLLLGVVLVAIYIPASRAARIDPMEALRYE